MISFLSDKNCKMTHRNFTADDQQKQLLKSEIRSRSRSRLSKWETIWTVYYLCIMRLGRRVVQESKIFINTKSDFWFKKKDCRGKKIKYRFGIPFKDLTKSMLKYEKEKLCSNAVSIFKNSSYSQKSSS